MPSPQSTPRGWLGLPPAVWRLGFTSLFTDTATEAVYPLLPLFLTRVLGAGALTLGLIEGAAEGVSSLLKVVSGRLSDRWQVRRPIVIAGYGLSSLARPFIALVGSWPELLLIRLLDRFGKGVRSAPRDAILAAWASATTRGRVFGFHQAMDHAGAVIGPLVATAFLLVFPDQYRTLFALTIVPGAIAVWLLFKVPEKPDTLAISAGEHEPGVRGAAAVTMSPASTNRAESNRLPGNLHRYFAVLLLFALGNSSDAFLLLRFSNLGFAAATIPLLWALLHVVKMVSSALGGAFSDRAGRRLVIVAGWFIYAVVYGGFAIVGSPAGLVALFLTYGVYYGLTEGNEKALVADLAPAHLRGTAFGIYNAVIGVGALVASVAFGALWKWSGAPVAFGVGAALALAAAGLLPLVVPSTQAGAQVAR
jgi:MFS family permease